MTFTPELESKLEQALEVIEREETVLLLFTDMIDINEHFQAALDWFKGRGNKMTRRWGQGAKMERGWVYFAGADTHCKILPDGTEEPIVTRGVTLELDLRPEAHELVRQVGLEARLRERGMA